MTDENGTNPEQFPGLNEAVAQAVREALAAGGALPREAPPTAGLQMAVTPKLGLKQPALDDPALITDINDNMTILDNSITATGVATLTNKTLTAPIINNPTITGWTNAQHSHLDAAGAGQLDGGAIVSGDIGTGFLVRESYVQDYLNAGADLVDAVVRDALWFGVAGGSETPTTVFKMQSAGNVSLATAKAHFGIGVLSPLAPHVDEFLQIGAGLFLGSAWTYNSYFDGTVNKAMGVGPATSMTVNGGQLILYATPAATAAGETLTFGQRLHVGSLGGTNITPAAAETLPALRIGQGLANTQTPMLMLSRNVAATHSQWIAFQSGASVGDFQIGRRNGSDDLTFAAWNGVNLMDRMRLAFDGSLVLGSGVYGSAAIYLHAAGIPETRWLMSTLYQNDFTIMDTVRNGAVPFRITRDGDNLSLAPNAAYPAILVNQGNAAIASVPGLNLILQSQGAQNVSFWVGGGYVHPITDNVTACGAASARWSLMYSVGGVVNSSVYEAKEQFAPLDPEACAQAVLETDWVNFTYRPPAPPEPVPVPEALAKEEVETDVERRETLEQGNREALDAYATRLKETAYTRHQKGYVLQSPVHKVADLFGLEDRASASPGSDLAVVACALQNALQRLTALEAAGEPDAPTGTTTRARTTRRKAA